MNTGFEESEELAERSVSVIQQFPEFSFMFVGVAALNSLLQGIFFTFEGASVFYNVAGVLLAITTTIFAGKYLAKRAAWLFWLVSLLLWMQFGLFIANFAGAVPPFSLRLLQVGILVSYIAIVMATLLARTRLIVPAHAFLVACSMAMGVFIVEAVQELPQFSLQRTAFNSEVEWSVKFQPHPVLGERYAPNSEFRTYYPDNSRGYFEIEDGRKGSWRLNVHEDASAELAFPEDNPDRVRINIEKVTGRVPWHVQLNQGGLSIKTGLSYTLVFKARADTPRRIAAAVSRNHQPWNNLGLYQDIELVSQWHEFRLDFTAVATDDNGRVHFDVGADNSLVDLSDVKLLSLPYGKAIEGNTKRRFFVNYRINSIGCRGPDYRVPKLRNTNRILLLGDSYTLGVGVHEEDTFARKLEGLLNGRTDRSSPGAKYEVINCGESGYSTRDERLFYEVLGAQYEPNLVLLVMYSNDDISWRDEQKMPHVSRRRQKLESLFYTWGRLQLYRHERPFPDYSGCVTEIFRLRNNIRAHGGRLAVVFFRDVPRSFDSDMEGRYWNALDRTVRKGLQGTDVPILDLRDAFFASRSREDLEVHAIDGHLNEIGHAIAAREILAFLHEKGLLNPGSISRGVQTFSQRGPRQSGKTQNARANLSIKATGS